MAVLVGLAMSMPSTFTLFSRRVHGLRHELSPVFAGKLSGIAWDLSDLGRVPIAGKEGPSQAAVAEPSMVEELEHRIVQLYETGYPRWSCLLADWLIMSGCLSHRHLERSFPICVTQSTAHFSLKECFGVFSALGF